MADANAAPSPSLTRDLHIEATYRLTEALVASESRMRRRVEMLSDVVFETDSEHRLVFVNRAWERAMGMDGASSIGHPLTDHLHPEDWPVWVRATQSTRDSTSPPGSSQGRLRLRRRDGTLLWVEISVARIEDGDGAGGMVGVLRDISQQKTAQDQLARLSQVVRSSDHMVVITDAQGRIDYANPAFLELTGYRLDEIMGSKPGALLQGPDTDPATVRCMGEAVRGRKTLRIEVLNYTKNRSPYWAEIKIMPILSADGEDVECFISVQSNTTDRKQWERELLLQKASLEQRVQQRTAELAEAKDLAEAATQVKSAFLATMSHEIRTPINAIVGLSHLCLQTELNAQQRDYVSKTARAATSLIRLVSDILDFSKMDAGSLDFETLPFSPTEVANQVQSLLGELAHAKGLDFQLHLSPGLPARLMGDAMRLEQVLVNLVGNAIKFTARGAVTVSIAVKARHEHACELACEVRDTGIGLSQAQVTRLFTPFSQADSSTTREYGGTGLGLAIAKRLVERMAGQIWVDSTPGMGSVFGFTARFAVAGEAEPVQRVEPVAAREFAAWREVLQGVRVLAAEDNEVNQQVLLELLQSVGATVTLAGNGREALDRLNTHGPFDLVLMDMRMPDMDGLEATRLLRRRPELQGLVVIATSANITAEDRQCCMAAGMDDFEPKPIVPARLYETMVRWMKRKAEQPQAAHHRDELFTPAPGVQTRFPAMNGRQGEIDTANPIDLTGVHRLFSKNPDKLGQVLDVFLRMTKGELDRMSAASGRGDLTTVGQVAHKLKSSAAAMGAMPFAKACQDIEQASRAGDWHAAHTGVVMLPGLLEQVTAQLRQIRS